MFPTIETITGGFDEVMEVFSGDDPETTTEIFEFTANLAWNGEP
jgi:hypothetical protein